jgi:hypothetical protein
MARSMRNDLQPEPAPEEQVAQADDHMTLTVGDAGLGSECWPGARGIGSGTPSNVMGAPRGAAVFLRRAAPTCGRHCPRPSQPAEARFTAAEGQFLTK